MSLSSTRTSTILVADDELLHMGLLTALQPIAPQPALLQMIRVHLEHVGG